VAVDHPLLERALAGGRVAHAYAFVGPPGSGRRRMARAFARTLLGADRPDHPDLHVVVPTPPEDRPKGPTAIRIGDIRALERVASLRPALASWKVFILEDADRMTGEAPQAFLKTLEEPPPGTVIILILSRVAALPATVLSRCQIVRFRLPAAVSPEADLAAVRRMVQEVRSEGMAAVLRHAQTVDRDRMRAEALVDAVTGWYRERLLALAAGRGDQEIARDAASLGEAKILAGLAHCREARRALAVNVSPRLTLETVLLRLTGWADAPGRAAADARAPGHEVARAPVGGLRERADRHEEGTPR
jgi:DNA polymerase-3 subunit delta'